MEAAKVNKSQIQRLIKERNEYRELLEGCLYTFNSILLERSYTKSKSPANRMAEKIEKLLKKWGN